MYVCTHTRTKLNINIYDGRDNKNRKIAKYFKNYKL